jgi:fatty-acyl-CoA synthase
VDGVIVYAVPDSRTGDQVMAALEMLPGHSFEPDAFATFLEEQRDLGTKWAPRYVRIVDALPVGATNKIDKRPLRAERWETTDPVWMRAPRAASYAPFTAADANALRAEFETNQRGNLLQ